MSTSFESDSRLKDFSKSEQSINVKEVLMSLDDTNVQRTAIQDAPVIKTSVFQEKAEIVREIVHIVPVIHKEIHEREVINKDITHEKHLIQKEIHEVPIHVTEIVKHDVEIRGELPKGYTTQKEVVREKALVDEEYIRDKAVLGKIVEHEKNLITKEIHQQPLVEKEIIHERPIIEREVKENLVHQNEFVRDNTITKDMMPAEREVQREYIKEKTDREQKLIKEKALLVNEIVHDKPLIQKEIYNKDVITKDIRHEMPVIEKRLVETASHQSEVVEHPTQVEQTVVIEKPIYEEILVNLGTSSHPSKLRWLDDDRFEIEGQGKFRRFSEKFHGPFNKLNKEKAYFMKKGALERYNDRLYNPKSYPMETLFLRD